MTRDELQSVGALADAAPVGAECPVCGNADMDSLALIDAHGVSDSGGLVEAAYEHVECSECGSCYVPWSI